MNPHKQDKTIELLEKKLIPLCFYDRFFDIQFYILFNATTEDMQAFLIPIYGKEVVADHGLWFCARQAAIAQFVTHENVGSVVLAFDKNSSSSRKAILHESIHAAQFVLTGWKLWDEPEVAAMCVSYLNERIVEHLKKHGKKLREN